MVILIWHLYLSILPTGMGKLKLVSNALQMQYLCPRLWLAIAISTLTIVDSYAAIAQPKSRFFAKHIAERVTTAKDRSPGSGRRELIANTGSKSAIQPKKIVSSSSLRSKNIRPSSNRKYPSRVGSIENKSLRGVSHLTDTNLDPTSQVSPVDRLIE